MNQNANEIKNRLQEYVEAITEKSKHSKYVCPLCNSGHGKNGTGAFSLTNDKLNWRCFSCGEGGDIFDLYGKINLIDNYSEQLKGISEYFGISTSDYANNVADLSAREIFDGTENVKASIDTQAINNDEMKNFFLQAQQNITKTDYWEKRGLSKETVKRFGLGFVNYWKHPKVADNPYIPSSPRLIIPTGASSYLARDTRELIPEAQRNYAKSKVGKLEIFNSSVLQTAKSPIFVVEGEIDALSIIEVGGEALALGTTSKVKAFLDLLREKKTVQPIVIALDNDESGKKATGELKMGLETLRVPFCEFQLWGEYKDVNEALQNDREALKREILGIPTILNKEEQDKKNEYLKTSTINHLQSFLNGIKDSVNTTALPTGFSRLDSMLDGGLYEGLYIVGGISSLGKTTLVMQLADQLADLGNQVLIFSLEMSRFELMSKSISRHSLRCVLADNREVKLAKTARGITTGARYLRYSDDEKKVIDKAVWEYGKYAKRLYINEGIGDIGVREIRETINQHISYTGKTPIVIIDYLQILAPYNERFTDKQNTDKSVLELKRISRDFKTPVIGISSLNRANYRTPIAMEAFKESGAIEYSSDVLLGLQFKGVGSTAFDVNEAKAKNPREVELVVLKNRNGRTGETLSFKYYAMFNCFEES